MMLQTCIKDSIIPLMFEKRFFVYAKRPKVLPFLVDGVNQTLKFDVFSLEPPILFRINVWGDILIDYG